MSKRLTDAEIAAEYWRNFYIRGSERGLGAARSEPVDRGYTLLRFASHPHYNEAQP